MSDRVTPPFRGAPADRLPVAGAVTGATPGSAGPTPDDFAAHRDRDGTVNGTRPDLVGPAAPRADPVGAAGRGVGERIFELSRRGAELTRSRHTTPDAPNGERHT